MSFLAKIKEKQDVYNMSGTLTIIYGKHKVGKTTLAMDFPDPLLIDAEGGTARFDETRQFHLEHEMLQSKQTAYQVLNALGLELQKCTDYKTVIIDTADALWEFLSLPNEFRNRQGSIKQQAYTQLYTQYRTLLKLFRSNGRNVVLTCHTKEVKNDEGNILATNPKLPGSFGEDLCGSADLVCFMAGTSKTVEEHGEKTERVFRYAVCQPSQHPTYGEIRAGNRGTLPRYVENPTYETIKDFREVHPGLFDGKGDAIEDGPGIGDANAEPPDELFEETK